MRFFASKRPWSVAERKIRVDNIKKYHGIKISCKYGCRLFSQVEFTADTLKLNLIDLGRTESKLITVAGHVDFMCQEVEAADPVTFTTRDSNLVSLLYITLSQHENIKKNITTFIFD